MGTYHQTCPHLSMLKLAIFTCLLAAAYALKYSECMADSAIKVNSVELAPYPPNLSQGFKATYDVDVLKTIDGNVDVSLKLQKKMGIWITIPCTGNVGSCTYKDICTLVNDHGLNRSSLEATTSLLLTWDQQVHLFLVNTK